MEGTGNVIKNMEGASELEQLKYKMKRTSPTPGTTYPIWSKRKEFAQNRLERPIYEKRQNIIYAYKIS